MSRQWSGRPGNRSNPQGWPGEHGWHAGARDERPNVSIAADVRIEGGTCRAVAASGDGPLRDEPGVPLENPAHDATTRPKARVGRATALSARPCRPEGGSARDRHPDGPRPRQRARVGEAD